MPSCYFGLKSDICFLNKKCVLVCPYLDDGLLSGILKKPTSIFSWTLYEWELLQLVLLNREFWMTMQFGLHIENRYNNKVAHAREWWRKLSESKSIHLKQCGSSVVMEKSNNMNRDDLIRIDNETVEVFFAFQATFLTRIIHQRENMARIQRMQTTICTLCLFYFYIVSSRDAQFHREMIICDTYTYGLPFYQ